MIKIGYNNSLKHWGGDSHYEKPERTHYCVENLKSIYEDNYFISVSENDIDYEEKKEFAIQLIKQVHSSDYLTKIKYLRTNFIICRSCNKRTILKSKRTLEDFIIAKPNCLGCDNKFNYDNIYCYASVDTYFTGHTFEIALEGVMVLNELLNQMKNTNLTSFGIIRPPGHHCNNDPNGFCVFNNVFVSAKQAQKHGWQKVLILDVDFHHGDGTQELVEKHNDPDISFVSIHGFGENIYPRTGKESNLEKNILNIPLNMDLGPDSRSYITDEFYQNILVNQVFPFINQQNPNLIIISLGFDAHCDDPLEGMNITDETYMFLTQKLKKLNIPLLFVLEGGYNIETINRLLCKMITIFQ